MIRGIVSAGDRLVLSIVSEGQLGLRVHSWGGTPTARITPPSPGGLVADGWPILRQESALSSPVLWRANGRSGSLRPLTKAELQVEDGVCERHEVPVSGGERIWIEVARRGGDRAPRPTLLYAYGFLNHVLTAECMPVVSAFTAAGGAFVFAHLRGGGEYGPESWHHAQAHRQETTVEDLFAVIRYLIQLGISDADRIAFSGGSAGGLLAGIALTQRPELFRVVAAIGPLADFVRLVEWLGPNPEFGTPGTEAVRSLSPYHLVRDGQRYPAVLIGCGDRDAGLPAWHARKFTARLREANSAATPILLRVWHGGHEVCDAVAGIGERGAECLAFLMDRLGMSPAVP